MIPVAEIPRVEHLPDPFDPHLWTAVPRLAPFTLADGSVPALQQTVVRACWDEAALYVRFDCEDRDAWGTLTRRDDPLWQEEVVELFLAPGEEEPRSYWEFEVSPKGVLFDARIENPTWSRADLVADTAWDCPGIAWAAGPGQHDQDWWAVLALPWAGIAPAGPLPRVWRANFYRVERPRDGAAEFSCWSPTLATPPDFHRPWRFGVLRLATASPSLPRRRSDRGDRR